MAKKYTREQIFDRLKSILADDFEIEPEKLVLDANLFEDLELDSIDAVDLAVKLQEFTEKNLKTVKHILSQQKKYTETTNLFHSNV